MRVKNFFAPTSLTCGECMLTEPLRRAFSARAVREAPALIAAVHDSLLAHLRVSLLSEPHHARVVPTDAFGIFGSQAGWIEQYA